MLEKRDHAVPQDPEAAAWVERLKMQAHPEGGWYRETHRSPKAWPSAPRSADAEAGTETEEERSAVTSIVYLLEKGHFSAFHRLGSEELWFHHGGADLLLYELTAPAQALGSAPLSGVAGRLIEHRLSSRPFVPSKRGPDAVQAGGSSDDSSGEPSGGSESDPGSPHALPQLVIPPGNWFASEPDPEDAKSWVLCGCVVVPGFSFSDFTMASADELLPHWPSAEGLIRRLTRS